ncbi:Bacterial regulatory proteins, luxR family [Vibrio ruber DSM 16370]|uniref:Bacterial regulatory proteins, luxR family n=1 Tax=Vibrio ruber (strain DSM 16370 / JCM 11486 / BCRC 17186 / CECT 7878 / LMG 23124 / VR1) TaxID=1123498 RepID=A0A1R4LS74_VIBR1|nr:LuxR C-terminal-related transcriptional regulator [Vibrio ruber]SJN59239.1 Bacterial regulatory proteins, luxR family [Vibrio ruber DSM 16370]
MILSSDLISFWDSLDWPCGLKDTSSRFIYVNEAYRRIQNLPKSYDIVGRDHGELPTESSQYRDEFQNHDRLVLETKEIKSSIEIHPVGKEKILEGWILHKRPFFYNNEIIGVYFWGEPAQKLDLEVYTIFGKKPGSITLTPPNSTLSKREWEVLYFLLNGANIKRISKEIGLEINTIRKYIDNIKHKFGLYSQSQIVDYCKSNNWDRYVPLNYLVRHRIIN